MTRARTVRALRRSGAVLLALLAGSGAAGAQPTLAEAVAAAWERDPERPLAASEHELAAALRRRGEHPLAGDPAFNLRHDTDGPGTGDGFREWEAGVALPLWWPGQKDAGLREAERTGDAAGALERARRLEVAGEVRSRLWALALARSAREEARLALASAEPLEADVARRVEAGELPRSDLLLARRETVDRRDALERAESVVEEAERRYALYTGLQEAPPAAAEALAGEEGDLADDHPALALASARVERARAARDRVASERRAGSTLWVGGKRTREVAGDDYASALAVEVTVPLGSRAHAAPALARAEAALTAASAERARTRRELAGALEAARIGYDRAEGAVARARERAGLAAESLRLARRAFELGETDLVRLLRVRGEALAARQELESRRLALGRAAARLNQSLGVLPR